MTDQVSALRSMVSAKTQTKDKGLRVISVTSGKGGVGKTNFTVNLALALISSGYRVTILDGDLGLANVNVACGLNPRYTIENLLSGEKSIEDILVQGPGGMLILAGGSGVQELAELNLKGLQHVIANFSRLEKLTDFLIIDTGAGLGHTVTNFLNASDDIILLTTQEPTAITDAYGLLKTLTFNTGIPISVVINRVKTEDEARATYRRLEIAVERFLNGSINMLGWIYEDPSVGKAVMLQEPLGVCYPDSPAFQCIKWLANSIVGNYNAAPKRKVGIVGFLRSLLQA